MIEDPISMLVHWIHVVAAIVAVGGAFFMRAVLRPSAIESLSDDEHERLRAPIMKRWKLAVMICIALLLLSGIYNFAFVSLAKAKDNPTYHIVFTVKLLAALGVFFLASVLTGRSPAFENLRKNAGFWLALTVTLGLLVTLLGSVLRSIQPV